MTEYLTPEGYKKLKEELEYLKTVKRREIAKQIKEAAAMGDLKENAAYQIAKENQSFIEGRILELEEILKNAKIIKTKHNGKVEVGSVVTLQIDGKKERYQIVGPQESNPFEGKISYQSPLGKALLNKRKGDKIKVNGREYLILEIK